VAQSRLQRDPAQLGEGLDAGLAAEAAVTGFLTPPKGIWASSCTGGPLTWQMPDSIRRATCSVRPTSAPNTAAVPLTVVVGGGVTAGFVHQSRDFANACGAAARYIELPDFDHYSIMSLLETPHAPLARLIEEIARPEKPTAAPRP
jgi:hypothetical protein